MFSPGNAACVDFASRFTFLVPGSRNLARALLAVSIILQPAPEFSLLGPALPTIACRAEASSAARVAAVAFVTGDVDALSKVASASSPQLSRCRFPDDTRITTKLTAEPMVSELRGNQCLAVALVELRFQTAQMIGGDPFAVILRRESNAWKAVAVTNDVFTLQQLAYLLAVPFQEVKCLNPPPSAQLKYPEHGGVVGSNQQFFAWFVETSGIQPVAQLCQIMLDGPKRLSWPRTRIRVLTENPPAHSIPADGQGLSGISSESMAWSVWTIGHDGQITFSATRDYKRPNRK
jgi:hypothetical protein